MALMVSRTTFGISTYVEVVISPATSTTPVVTSVSHATRPIGSSASTASSTASEIWSASLSGWPSVTDSEVKRYRRPMVRRIIAADRGRPGMASRVRRPAQQGGEPVADGAGQLLLGPFLERRVLTLPAQDGRPIGIRSETRPFATHLVHHDQVEVL